ncbi:MAG: hypothetical protein QW587_04860 [Candidatus Bathyarchaeia archaeon]
MKPIIGLGYVELHLYPHRYTGYSIILVIFKDGSMHHYIGSCETGLYYLVGWDRV